MDQFFILSLTAAILTLYLKVHLLHFFSFSTHIVYFITKCYQQNWGEIDLFYILVGSTFLYKFQLQATKKVLKLYLFTSIKVVQKLFGSRVQISLLWRKASTVQFDPFFTLCSIPTYVYIFCFEFFFTPKKNIKTIILIFLIVVSYYPLMIYSKIVYYY